MKKKKVSLYHKNDESKQKEKQIPPMEHLGPKQPCTYSNSRMMKISAKLKCTPKINTSWRGYSNGLFRLRGSRGESAENYLLSIDSKF